MSAHNHSEFVEGCYRCDLSRDEVTGYTPTTDDVAEAWAARYDGEHTSASGDERRGYEAEFDRWLAQYTAEVRAAALSEQDETEWEYGPAFKEELDLAIALISRDIAQREVDGWNQSRRRTLAREGRDIGKSILVRRRKAGPWMPVEGEAG